MSQQSRFFCDILHLFSHVYVIATIQCGSAGLIKVEEVINHVLCIVKLVANNERCEMKPELESNCSAERQQGSLYCVPLDQWTKAGR